MLTCRIMWKTGNSLFWLCLSFCWLIAGTGLYVFLRPLPWMPWERLFEQPPAWLHQQLPDALWAAAFASFLLYIAPGRSEYWKALLWPLLCTGAIEVLQAIHIWPGTADGADLAGAGFGCMLVWFINMLKPDEKEATNP